MAIKQVTPPEAHALLGRGCRYLDVRTETEFAEGHPEGAVNIPVVFPDPATGGMHANANFVAVVAAHFPPDTKLVIGCASGRRSQMAAEMLAQAGYSDLHNMQGGFGGVRDQAGRTVTPGWRDSGLPLCGGCGPESTYAGLRGDK